MSSTNTFNETAVDRRNRRVERHSSTCGSRTKLLERTCQVRNRVRQSRTLGSGVPGELAKGRGCKSPVTKE